MAPKSVTFQRHDHLVSVLFGDLLSHSYNITFSMFLDLVLNRFGSSHNQTIFNKVAKETKAIDLNLYSRFLLN